MINTQFEVYKIKREIKRSGTTFKLYRNKKNEFNETIEEDSFLVGSIKGLYHEQNGYISVISSESSQYRSKKIPMILCLFEDVASINLEKDDYILIGKNKYTLSAITNVQNWNIIADISLEEKDYAGTIF